VRRPARSRLLRDHASTAELDVVGMGAEGHDRRPLRELDIRLVRSIDRVPPDEGDLRRVLQIQIVLLAGARHVVRAAQDGLHPAEPRIPRRADLLLAEAGRRKGHEGLAALVQQQRAVRDARANDLAFVRHVDVEVAHLACAPPQGWIARADDLDPVEQPMRRYISRQKSATVSADVFPNRSISSRST
jgi:hypothetical protein